MWLNMWNGSSFLFIFILLWQAHFKRESENKGAWKKNVLSKSFNPISECSWLPMMIWQKYLLTEIDLRLIWDWSEIWPVLAQNLQINLEAKRIALCHCACPKRQFCPWFLPRSCKTKTRDMQYPLGAFNNYVDKKRRVGGQ